VSRDLEVGISRSQLPVPYGANFFIFVQVYVSCDFEVGTNVGCEESTRG